MRRVLALAVALACGCSDRVVIGENDANWAELRLGVTRRDVDLLLVVDNSPSMGAKQRELALRLPELAARLDASAQRGLPAHFHLGVVTTDLGAQQFTIGAGQCRPGGDGANLQALGAAAPPGCLPPTGGARFIDYDQLTGTSNLPAGQDLAATLACMTAVGDTGCGFEQPLEVAYQALQTPGPPANVGFLRDPALLAVVFLTDEDDCSAPPGGDLFDPSPAAIAKYGPLLSFRCTQFGIACGTPPAAPSAGAVGALQDCAPALDGPLFDVGRYVQFFRLPKAQGGVKPYPGDAFLFAIAAPREPVMVVSADLTQPPGPYVTCAPTGGARCATVLQHSCVSTQNPALFGDPPVRLDWVVQQTLPSLGGSICDSSYATPLDKLAATLADYQAGNGCLPGPLPNLEQPDCQVFDVVANADGSVTDVPLPWCPDAHDAPPCWRIDALGDCGTFFDGTTMAPQHLQLVIDRGSQPPPPNSVPHARCVIAPS
jgi:hypothetical protein